MNSPVINGDITLIMHLHVSIKFDLLIVKFSDEKGLQNRSIVSNKIVFFL
jgi:hypothetical protein